MKINRTSVRIPGNTMTDIEWEPNVLYGYDCYKVTVKSTAMMMHTQLSQLNFPKDFTAVNQVDQLTGSEHMFTTELIIHRTEATLRWLESTSVLSQLNLLK